MLPELLRYSSASRLLDLIPEELQEVHRSAGTGDLSAPAPTTHEILDDEPEVGGNGFELDDYALAALGL
jgi:hypothetical protein